MGTRAAVLVLLFGLLAAACEGRALQPTNATVDVEAVSRHTAAERAESQASIPGLTADAIGANSDDVSVTTNLNQVTSFGVTKIQTGTAGATLNISVGARGGNAVVTGDQIANGARISLGGSTVSVISNLSASSNVSVTSSSTASDGSSVVNVSVTTGSGSVNRTVRFDGAGKFVLRVTAEGDGVPVIQVEEVGP